MYQIKKRKVENGFSSLNAPIEKEEKMLGTIGWVGSFDVAEAGL